MALVSHSPSFSLPFTTNKYGKPMASGEKFAEQIHVKEVILNTLTRSYCPK
jgi:hypothetical protein